jgi:hypothetical protein
MVTDPRTNALADAVPGDEGLSANPSLPKVPLSSGVIVWPEAISKLRSGSSADQT